jgi:hypothetical protein
MFVIAAAFAAVMWYELVKVFKHAKNRKNKEKK